MAMNFPADPQDGDIYESYLYDGAIGAWIGGQNNYATIVYVDSNLAEKLNSDEKGQPSGVATLDSNGHVTSTQLAALVDSAPQNLDTLGKIATQFVLKTTTQWASHTGFLAEASINVEVITETGQVRVKIGDGSKTWAQADYVVMESDMTTYVAAELLDFLDTVTDITDTKANTSDVNTALASKLDATAAQTTYAPIDSPSFTTAATLPTNTSIGDVSSTEIGYVNGVTSGIQGQLDDKAPLESPTFTGTVSGVTKSMVGLGDVDNTADADKPVSTATQTALDAKAAISGQVFTGDIEAPNLVITGDLVVQGTTTTVNTTDYAVRDNMIYLNQAGMFTVTNAVGDGTSVVYTAAGHDYGIGDYIVVSGIDPAGYNIAGSANLTIDSVTTDTFTVLKTDIGTYVSGGVARGKSAANPDLGFAAGYNDGTYHHAGFFRDASDGVWKVFDSYTPEPDESVFIDTSHASFELADIQAEAVKAGSVVFTDGSVQTKAGVPSQTSFVYKTASYTLDTLTLADNVIEVDSTSATTITIPLDSSVDYPVGTSIDILQTNTGQVTIAATGGVTMNGTPGFKLRTRWSSATILKRAANTWIVFGDLMS